MALDIRRITPDDAQLWQELRLESLRQDPTSFASSYDAETLREIPAVAERIRRAELGGGFLLGAFLEGELVGTTGVHRLGHAATRHRAFVWGVYTSPRARRRGVGRALMDEALVQARAVDDLEQLFLDVGVGNAPARELYLAAGFEPRFVDRKALRFGETYVDEERMVLFLHGEDAG